MFLSLSPRTLIKADDAIEQGNLGIIRSPSGQTFAAYVNNPSMFGLDPASSVVFVPLDSQGNVAGPSINFATPPLQTAGSQIDSFRLLPLSDGRFALIYDEYDPQTDNADILYQIYSASFVPSGQPVMLVDGGSVTGHYLVDAVADPAGGFTFSYGSYALSGSGNDSFFIRSIGADGALLASSASSAPSPTLIRTSGGLLLATSDLFGTAGSVTLDFPGGAPPVTFNMAPYLLANAQSTSLYAQTVALSATQAVTLISHFSFSSGSPAQAGLLLVRFTDGQAPAVIADFSSLASSSWSASSFIRLLDGSYAFVLPKNVGGNWINEVWHVGASGHLLGTRVLDTGTASQNSLVSLMETSPGVLVATYKAVTAATGTDSEVFRETLRVITQTEGADSIVGTDLAEALSGLGGDDTVFGLQGNDTLIGGLGNDTLDGGLGVDEASYAADTLAVAANLLGGFAVQRVGQPDFTVDTLIGIENLRGGAGDDFLLGDNTANRLEGMGGGDNLWGFGGNDTLIGGEGNDIIVGGDDADSLESGLGQDWLYGQGGADTLRATDATANAFNVLVGGDGNDTLIGGPTGFDYFYGGDGQTGGGNDSFVIAPSSGTKVLIDFEAGGVNDVVRLVGTPLTSFAQVQAAISFSGTINGTVLVVDGATQVWFLGHQPVNLTAADFLFA